MAQLPAAKQAVARSLGHGVAGGQVAQVQHSLGPASVGAASTSFLHGYQLAVGLSALLLVAAAAAVLAGTARRNREVETAEDVRRIAAEGAT